MYRRLSTIAVLVLFGVLLGTGSVRAYELSTPLLRPLAAPIGTVFTYQGYLTDGGSPAQGEYDFEFKLYDDSSAGSQVGSTVPLEDVPVANGIFTVELDFGNVFDGTALWLEIGVRPGASTGGYEPLMPRLRLTGSAYAMYASEAPWEGLSGVPAGFADGTDDDTQLSETDVDLFVANNGYLDAFSPLDWDNITLNKPTTYPPETHQHGWTEITGKPSVYPPAPHTHTEYATIGEAGEFDGEVQSGMVEKGGVTTINFTTAFTTTAKPHFYVTVVLKGPANGLLEGAAIKAVEDIKGAAGNWTGFDLTVSKYSDGSSIDDLTQVYVTWIAIIQH